MVIIHSYNSKLIFDLLPRAKEWPHLHILNLISKMLHFQNVRFSQNVRFTKCAIFKMCDFRENRTFLWKSHILKIAHFENLTIWKSHNLKRSLFYIWKIETIHFSDFWYFVETSFKGKCFKDFLETQFRNLWKNISIQEIFETCLYEISNIT